jgi:hypothetical protein
MTPMLAAMRRASAPIRQSESRSDETDELGANFMTAPPGHLVCALPGNTVTGKEQHKFIGGVEIVDEEPHTTIGDVDYEAVAQWNSNSGLNLRHSEEAAAWRPASLLTHQRVHSGRLQFPAASTPLNETTYPNSIFGRLTSAREFSLHLFELPMGGLPQ